MRIFNPSKDALVRRVYTDPDADTRPGGLLAAKLHEVSDEEDEGPEELILELEQEVNNLSHLKHDNILRYVGAFWRPRILNICLEYFPGKTISSALKDRGEPFREFEIRKFTKQILQGLTYLHSNGIQHRRLRGENIRLNDDGNIKLAEFGLTSQPSDLVIKSGGWGFRDVFWFAPEVAYADAELSSDIWSLGCAVIEMATGQHPWKGHFKNAVEYLGHACDNTTSTSPPPIPELSQEAKEFLQKCLQGDPKLRPRAADLLMDPFVTQAGVESSSHLYTSALGTPGKGVKHQISASGQSVSGCDDPARSKIRAAFDDKTQELKKLHCGTSSAKHGELTITL